MRMRSVCVIAFLLFSKDNHRDSVISVYSGKHYISVVKDIQYFKCI